MKIKYINNRVYNLAIIKQLISKSKSDVFYKYDLKTGKSVYDLSLDLYGSENYAGLLLLINNFVNINDWYKNSSDLKVYLTNEYGEDLLKVKYYLDTRNNQILDETIDGTNSSHFLAVSNYDYEVDVNLSKKLVNVIDVNYISQIAGELKQ